MQLPEAFLANIKENLGQESDMFLAALTDSSPTSVRLNSIKSSPGLFETATTEVPWNSEGKYLKERPVFTLDPLFHGGAYYVQEASSMFLKHVFNETVNRYDPIYVLDLCAAPGGKSTLMADLLGEDDLLVVNDVIRTRVTVLKENLQKWGFENVIFCNQDPDTFADLEGFFDVVLVDAPCSGEGLFRKDKKAIDEWSEDNVKLCSMRQQRVLSAAGLLVKPEGVLIYSTCTYNNLENDNNVEWICRTLEFEKIPIKVPQEWGITTTTSGHQFYPHKLKGEGFYIAAMRQKGSQNKFVKARVNLQRISFKQRDIIEPWIKADVFEEFEYYTKNDGAVIALRNSLLAAYGSVFKAIYKRSSGFEIGVIKGADLVPSHAFALSNLINENVAFENLDKENALKFLKKEAFNLASKKDGWLLIKHQNIGLGFIKKIGDRINNYLPTEWRIRMELE
jgi:16S rRNA C967 or C1407 C5-methylase (RsmB/RsmF family)/NOL1/NOP2/fmu family ribosome biogenesis protein